LKFGIRISSKRRLLLEVYDVATHYMYTAGACKLASLRRG
jgi:hypothetical protein